MKTWRGYNVLDFVLIFSGLLSVIIAGILFGAKWYIIINSIFGLLCVFTQAKGKVITQVVGFLYCIFYMIIAYWQKLYGEALLYLIIMLPMYVYGIIHWFANIDKKSQEVIVKNNLSKNEWIVLIVGFVAISFGVFFLLKKFNTSQLILSTVSFVSMLPAVYLLARRCKWNMIAFLINDLVVPFLWLNFILHGSFDFIPMIVNYVFQIIYDIYGLIQWNKLEKKQHNKIN